MRTACTHRTCTPERSPPEPPPPPSWRCPMRRATIALDRIEPGLAELVLADPDLTRPATLALLYVLSHPHAVHGRHELAAAHQLVGDPLDQVLHELGGR